MSGKEIFDRYQLAALKNGLGSHEFNYGNVLYQALRIEGEEKIFKLLELAENTGKRIALAYSVPNNENGTEPNIVVLV
ncbi:hypothetical protein GCM10010967_27190 [Dyadobacter beijingensis]|uniref:Uncharacterized protein n=1 Tax=Dyadobacter beijingensis TaxID=365489 RepID=A0ABQ2HYJ6_9BACT|nr:hypothetical protein [Dyadobacter beijingensis]GGM92547.1 hypothetical protein GCM10010967_27190 [Dyadobacter beijingensis]